MNYTTVARVKAELRIAETTDDALIADQVARASRIVDQLCTGAPDSDDYFTLGDVTELLCGLISSSGHILCYPHRVVINSVTSFHYRINPFDTWHTVEVPYLTIKPSRSSVMAWTTMSGFYDTAQVQICYNGGLASSVDNLPSDVIDAATILAARLYREGESGLSDAVGISEFGVITYSKAFPARLLRMIQSYSRVVPW